MHHVSVIVFNNLVLSREFSKRMDADLPFYYWTLNERYTEDELPSFDVCPEVDEDQGLRSHPLRLHRLVLGMRTLVQGTRELSVSATTSLKISYQIHLKPSLIISVVQANGNNSHRNSHPLVLLVFLSSFKLCQLSAQ